MKKILFFAVVAVALVACGEETKTNNYYFDKEVSRLYNDPNAEMDTLSYAAGMNVGLVVSVQNADFELDTEEVIKLLDKELKKVSSDQEKLDEVNDYLSKYSSEIVRPYMMAKRMNSMAKTDRPDTLQLPVLYTAEYTKDKFCSSLILAVADGMRKQNLPVNLHWVYQAIRDAANVKDKSEIDSVMAIPEAEFAQTLRDYKQHDLSIYTADCATKWMEGISAKKTVKAMTDADGKETGVYYRINKAGGEPKPVNATDSIAVKYEVYSRTGKLLESNEMFIKNLKKQREQIEKNTMLPVEMRQTYIDKIDAEIANSDLRQLPLSTFMQKHVQDALKLIGKGGEITLWLNANKAFGPTATKILPINEAVVVNVELVDVKTIKPTPKPVGNVVTPDMPSFKGKVVPDAKASHKASKPTIIPVQK
jgi:FKBP-type peptidyl-prolyl cis-trans isomerase